MTLAHRIELDPVEKQKEYFAQACGAARFTWNWALAEWTAQYERSEKPNTTDLKRQFNSGFLVGIVLAVLAAASPVLSSIAGGSFGALLELTGAGSRATRWLKSEPRAHGAGLLFATQRRRFPLLRPDQIFGYCLVENAVFTSSSIFDAPFSATIFSNWEAIRAW
jgi:hypothetical protein